MCECACVRARGGHKSAPATKSALRGSQSAAPATKSALQGSQSAVLATKSHSSPVSRATETSHRVQGRGQDKDKRRTRPGHRAGPQSPATEFRGAAETRAREGQEEDKAQPQSPTTQKKRRTRPGHRAQPQRTRGGQGLGTEPSHRAQERGQEEDKRSTEPSHRVQGQPVSVANSFF